MNDLLSLCNRYFPCYLSYLDEYFSDESENIGKKVHILFVEGPTDAYVYNKIFSYSFNYLGENRKLSFTNENRIKTAYEKEFVDFMAEYCHEDDVSSNDSPSKVSFVKKLLITFNSMMNNLNSLDIYGFIDRDYGNNIRPSKRIDRLSQTTERDGETNLMVCYFNDYFNNFVRSDNYENAISNLGKILTFTAKQGIFGKASHRFLPSIDVRSSIKNITHYNFKNRCSQELFINQNFEDYVNAACSLDANFRSYYLEEQRKNPIDFDSIEEQLKDWLLNGNAICQNLVNCFRLSNGHILIQQMILLGDNIFGLYQRRTSENFLRNKLVECASYDVEKIYNLEPLNHYREWRISHNYIYY